MDWFIAGMQFGLLLSILIWIWTERTFVMRLFRHTLSWLLVPYIAFVALIWCIVKVKECRIEPSIKRHLDKMIKWNDTVLMGKEAGND